MVGLLAGRFPVEAIFHVVDGNIQGFLYSGITNMAGTILLCLTLFGVVGVFEHSGSMQAMIDWLEQRRITATATRTELAMGLGAMVCSVAFAGVTSAALIMFGPIGDRIGGQRILHLGYAGAQQLFDTVANAMIEKKQNDSPVGYFYM